jgi:hypothetical protein
MLVHDETRLAAFSRPFGAVSVLAIERNSHAASLGS